MRIRDEFTELKGGIFLNNAATSIMPSKSKRAIYQSIQEREYCDERRDTLRRERELSTRKKLAQLINASYEEIHLVSNTTEGLNIIANGIKFNDGENIIFPEYEHPANIVPWMNLEKNGVEVRAVPSNFGKDPTESILSTVDKKTRILSVSSVGWIDGFKMDMDAIGEFCRKRGLLFVVDAIQSVGSMKIDVKSSRISFLAAAGYKWLLSPHGTGFIYVNKDILNDIDIKYLGYFGIKVNPADFNYDCSLKDDATRFKLGSPFHIGIAAMEQSVKMLLSIGIDNIQEHILELTGYASEKIKEKNYNILSNFSLKNRSGIVSFDSSGIKQTYERLLKNNIIVSLRKNWIRISPHFYNNEDDINYMVKEL